jgi:hypothetical protein
MKATSLLSLACIVAALGLCSCGGTTKVENRTTTVGQELQDLDTARDKGLITEQEYQQKRKEIMKSK